MQRLDGPHLRFGCSKRIGQRASDLTHLNVSLRHLDAAESHADRLLLGGASKGAGGIGTTPLSTAGPFASLGAVMPAERWGWLGAACGPGWMAACSECAAAARTQAGAPFSASTRLWPKEGSFVGAALDLVNSYPATWPPELLLDGGPGGSDAIDVDRLAGSEPGSDTEPSVSV
eukprot:scaffold54261_cov60-Phaeocystis_antarctica.AAC.3